MTTETTDRHAYMAEYQRRRRAVERAKADAATMPAPVTVEPVKHRTDWTAEKAALPSPKADRGPGAAVRYGDPTWRILDAAHDPASPDYVFTMPLTPEHLARIKAAGARMARTGTYGTPLCGPRFAYCVNVNGRMVPVNTEPVA